MTKLTIEYCNVADLVPYARNPRRNDHAVERMVTAMRSYGCPVPLLVRHKGHIIEVIDGHLRLKAAHRLGLHQVPVIFCDQWTPEQVQAFRLVVNRSANWADFDEDLLSLEIADLKALGFDLSLTGFDGHELDELLGRFDRDDDADHVGPAPEEPVTRPGDQWHCGNHRVLCGDATNRDDVARLLGSSLPLVMITDPPFGVEYNPEWRSQAGLGELRQTGKIANDDRSDWTEAYRLFSGDIAYVWHAGVHAVAVAFGLQQAEFEIRGQIIWAKQHFALSRGNYHWQHEPCWYAVRHRKSAHWRGDRTQSTLWQVSNLNPFGGDGEEPPTGHGTQKPVEIMRRPILNHTERGELVYDPFLGSGTVLIAAELTDRICLGLEIEPRYVDMIVCRWQALTGRAAVLEGGSDFAQVKSQRLTPVDRNGKEGV